MTRPLIQSPLNYTGGKHKLLSQIQAYLPSDINTFIDLFCGGCNVGINIDCNNVVFNDDNKNLYALYRMFRYVDKTTLFDMIDSIIDDYGLSRSNMYGYKYYNCDSSTGLGAYNKDHFLRLRTDFNTCVNFEPYRSALLYVLIVYAFNNQIRFNRDGQFNLSVGKRDFNDKMRKKLSVFIDAMRLRNCEFMCRDFRNVSVEQYGDNCFVYADPPYLITCATYNENGGWTSRDEADLYSFLDLLDTKGIRFALSNVMSSNGRTNTMLQEWLCRNKHRYQVVHLVHSYANASYQKKSKLSNTDEILIVNYQFNR